VRRVLRWAALAASLALVFSLTLLPGTEQNHVALAPWAARQLNPINLVDNVALFALPSALLWCLGWPLRRTVVAGFLLSLGIELLQLAVPGRTTSTTDVICNTLGAAAGWLLARAFFRHVRAR
jgi:VanZ like protein